MLASLHKAALDWKAGRTSCSNPGTAAGGNASSLGSAEPAAGNASSRICGKWSSPPLSLRASCAGRSDVAQGERYGVITPVTVGTATGMVDAKAAPDPGDWLARRASGSLLPVDETLTYPVKRAVMLADVASASAPLMVATMFLRGPALA